MGVQTRVAQVLRDEYGRAHHRAQAIRGGSASVSGSMVVQPRRQCGDAPIELEQPEQDTPDTMASQLIPKMSRLEFRSFRAVQPIGRGGDRHTPSGSAADAEVDDEEAMRQGMLCLLYTSPSPRDS